MRTQVKRASGRQSLQRTGADPQQEEKDRRLVRWIPFISPALALFLLLAVYLIDWGVLMHH